MTARQRYHLNVVGDFYVEDGCCTTCGVPWHVAPDLFAEPAEGEERPHCYVRKQPVTSDELDRMIEVIRSAELQCILYAGHDAAVFARLRAIDELRCANNDTVILYRPVGQHELDLIRASGNSRFPPRLPEQPIFYPVCNEEYAIEIAERWNAPRSGVGFVTRFHVCADHLAPYEIQTVGARHHQEYWIPAENLDAFNDAIVGEIEVTQTFRSRQP